MHEEKQYLELLQNIIDSGELKPNRTEYKTKSLFGNTMRFNLSSSTGDKLILPLITTRKMFARGIIEELLFFVSGETDTKLLSAKNVKIWEGNTSREYLDSVGLNHYEVGDMGPGYSFCWRYFGADYQGCNADYTGQGVDQLSAVINDIKKNPFSRRLIVCAWDPSKIHQMALPSCHIMFQFNVGPDENLQPKYLDCSFTMRSSDVFLGLPFNITSYALLTHMIAKLTNLQPRHLVYTGMDTHIYENHFTQCLEQVKRTPYKFPELQLIDCENIQKITDFTLENFKIVNYQHHEAITGKMAV